jgi:hypothetical protein
MPIKIAWFSVCSIIFLSISGVLLFNLTHEGTFGFSEESIKRGSINTNGKLQNGYQKVSVLGRRNVSTLEYIGTGDGCSAVIYSTSSSVPSYNATSTSFCNP